MSNKSKRKRGGNVPSSSHGGRGPTAAELLYLQQEEHSGPLPHPDLLRRYDEIHPGTAERIVKVFEKEADHRRSIVHQIADSQTQRDRADERIRGRGQIFALVITVVSMIGSVLIGIYGSPWAGSLLGGATLISIVSAFLSGGEKKPKK